MYMHRRLTKRLVVMSLFFMIELQWMNFCDKYFFSQKYITCTCTGICISVQPPTHFAAKLIGLTHFVTEIINVLLFSAMRAPGTVQAAAAALQQSQNNSNPPPSHSVATASSTTSLSQQTPQLPPPPPPPPISPPQPVSWKKLSIC